MKNLKNLKEKKDNRGFSLVLVIVAMSVVALLIAVVLMIALQNYQMKVTGLHSEDNFYSAEQVIDEIKAGLQGDMSSSVSDAYSYVMEHYSETAGQDGTRNWYFQTQYVDNLYQKLLKSGTSDEYDLARLGNYIIKASSQANPAEAVATVDDEEESNGIKVEYADGSSVVLSCAVGSTPATVDESGAVVEGTKALQFNYDTGVTIKGLVVKYTNAKGYLSVISTDLVMGIPSLNFTQTASAPDLLSYCVIAEGGMYTEENIGVRTTLNGNVYTGSMSNTLLSELNLDEACSVYVDKSNLTVNAEEFFIAKDGILVKSVTTDNADAVEDGLYHFDHTGGALWTDGFTLDGATLSVDGDIFVRDDLTLNGKDSMAALAGSYLGYSNAELQNAVTDEAAASSAIIVNGRGSVLDFSHLDNLLLAGNGYVEVGDVVAASADASGYFSHTTTTNAIRMGESIAIKSNQLAYLAPASAIRVSNGTIAESGNPVGVKLDKDSTLSQLSIYLNTQVSLKELGGKSLRQLGIDATDCQKFIVQGSATDDGIYDIYVYMRLTEEKAARYFEAYYGSKMEGYARIYLPAVAGASSFSQVFDRDLSDIDRFDINGAIANVADHNMKKEDVRQEVLSYQKVFDSLCKKLITSFASLTDDEKADNATVYSNLINESAMVNFLSVKAGKTAVFATPETGMTATLVDGDYTVTSTDSKARLIVATGNVYVTANFKGLIICKGALKIKPGVTITEMPEDTAAVFQCIYDAAGEVVKYTLDGKTEILSPMYFFKEGEQYLLNGIASGYILETFGEQINLTDYIKFTNWKKK